MPTADSAPHSRPPASWWPALALAGLMLVLQAGGAPVRAALRYERAAVLGGQIWRICSAHFVHLSWTHCLLNLAALALCVVLARGTPPARSWWATTLVLAAGVGSLLLLAAPEVPNYVGFSGVMYGLFVCVLLPQSRQGDRLALILLLLLLARIVWQLVWASPLAEFELIGGSVVAQAHLYGAACGMAWSMFQSRRKGQHRTTSS